MEKIRGVLAGHGDRARRAHPRPRPRRPRPRARRGGRPRAELRARARRRWASSCPATRRACTRSGCPAIALKTRARPEAGQRRAVDALPPHPGLPQGGRAARGLRLLPDRPRRRGRDPAPLRPRHRLRRRGLDRGRGRATRGSRSTAPATARSLLGPDAADGLAAPPGRDGRRRSPRTAAAPASTPPACGRPAHAREIAEALAERLAAHRARAPRTTPRPSSRPSPTPTWRARISAMIDRDLRGPGRGGRHGRATAAGRGSCEWEGATYLLPTIVLLRVAGPPAGQPRVPVPVRGRGAGAAPRRCPTRLGPTLAATAITEDAALARAAAGLAAPPPPEPGPAAHLAGELGPAARGQPLRAPLRAPRPAGPPGRS